MSTKSGGAGRSLAGPEFAKLSQFGVVPVIDHDGLIMRKSNTIVRYLAAVQGRTDLLPVVPEIAPPSGRWMDWQATDLNSSWRPAFHALVRGHKAAQSEMQRPKRRGRRTLGASMRIFQHPGYLAGDDFTVADICIGLAPAPLDLYARDASRNTELPPLLRSHSRTPGVHRLRGILAAVAVAASGAAGWP